MEESFLLKKEKVESLSGLWKRGFDIFFSLSMLILGSFIYILLSALVYLTSPGPVFFKSTRLEKNGKIIKLWKFRTMHIDAEKKLAELLVIDPILKAEWDSFQKLKKDPRITPIGHFLRKYSLDELPQFWNILVGDLSVVGPRPFVLMGEEHQYQEEIRYYLGDKTAKILSIRPGLTGIWQISGRSSLSIEERVLLEEFYVDHHSFFVDLKIICKTIPSLFSSKGAF